MWGIEAALSALVAVAAWLRPPVTLGFGLAPRAGPQLGRWIADRTGSFSTAFLVAAVAELAAAVASATRPRPRVVPPGRNDRRTDQHNGQPQSGGADRR